MITFFSSFFSCGLDLDQAIWPSCHLGRNILFLVFVSCIALFQIINTFTANLNTACVVFKKINLEIIGIANYALNCSRNVFIAPTNKQYWFSRLTTSDFISRFCSVVCTNTISFVTFRISVQWRIVPIFRGVEI